MSPTPEQNARKQIDAALEAAGWIIQDRVDMNVAAAPGVAVREFKMAAERDTKPAPSLRTPRPAPRAPKARA